jgi:branched-chain amino acid aminotransferase
VTPIRELDDRRIGPGRPGQVTRQLQEQFQHLVRGGESKRREWLTIVA